MIYDRTELKNIQLKKDEKGHYYIDVLYEMEDKKGIYEMHIPRIGLPICDCRIPDVHSELHFNEPTACILVDDLPLIKDKTVHTSSHVCWSIKTLEEKCQEMTISEIEKKLGYKIKIVNDKE